MPRNKRTYHGWIVVEPYGDKSFKDIIWVEYREHPQDAERKRLQIGYGESGCASAVEWWDKRVNMPVKLEPMLKGSYRVYTEAEDSA